MNLCFTIRDFTGTGGSKRMMSILANNLYKNGHHVIVVNTSSPRNSIPVYPFVDGIRVYGLKGSFVKKVLSKLPLTRKFYIEKYRKILISNKIDIIINVLTDSNFVSIKASKGLPVKNVSWDHYNYNVFKRRSYYRKLRDLYINDVDKIVLLTKRDVDAYVCHERIPKEKIHQIYNPVTIEQPTFIEHNAKKIISVGRYESQKGFDILLKIWKNVENEFPDWELEIIGTGSKKDELNEYIHLHNIKHVTLSSFTNEIQEKYRNASIYLMTSRYEGFPLVLLEASAFSLPMISFDCFAGPSEIIEDGCNGFLIKQNDIECYTQRLVELMKNESLRAKMSKNSYLSSKQFSLINYIRQWESLLKSMS